MPLAVSLSGDLVLIPPSSGSTPNLTEVLAVGSSAGGSQINSLADPTSAGDAATKQYVDGIATQIIQLPVWTFDPGLSGSPASGFFQLNNANPTLVSSIIFNPTAKNGVLLSPLLALIPIGTLLILTDNVGKNLVLQTLTGISGGFSSYIASVTPIAGDSSPLNDDYTFSFASTLAAQDLSSVLIQSSITPIADGTYFGITFKNGIAIASAQAIADTTVTPVTSLTFSSGGAVIAAS